MLWIPGESAALLIEEVEDFYIFGLLITGFLLIGFGEFLIYWEIKKVGSHLGLGKAAWLI